YHPPYQALFLVPFAYLPYRTALVVWMLCGIAAVLLSAHLLKPFFPEIRRLTGVPLALIFLAFWPIVQALPYGLGSMFVLLFLAIGFRYYCRQQDFSSGATLSAALFKFQYIIPTVGILFLRGRTKLVAGAILVGIVVLIACWAVVGTGGMVDYWNMLRNHPQEVEWQMVNLRGLIHSVRGTYSPIITVLASILVTLWA